MRAKHFSKIGLLEKLSRYDAIIVDDIGYVQQSRQQMQVLFTLLADRYERGSVMITNNLPFSKWEQIFKGPVVTAAAIDRLMHHSVILVPNIESYRMKVAKKNKSKNLMARQKALYQWILGNAILWAGHRSLNVGHLTKPFFVANQKRSRNMEQTVYNPQKGRLETINIEFTDRDTTWFDDFTFTTYQEPISAMITAEQEHCTDNISISKVDGDWPSATQVKLQLPFGLPPFHLAYKTGKKGLYHFIWGPAPKPPGFSALKTKV